MKLYYTPGACSLAIRIVTHEIGILCHYEPVNPNTYLTERGVDYLQINPKGTFPTLLCDDGHRLTGTAVIQQFLADKYEAVDLLPPVGRFERYEALEWLNFDSTHLHKNFAALFNSDIPTMIKEEVFMPPLKEKLNRLNQHLTAHTYLASEHFSLADGYLFAMLRWVNRVGLELSQWNALVCYAEKIKTRPAVDEALREKGEVAF